MPSFAERVPLPIQSKRGEIRPALASGPVPTAAPAPLPETLRSGAEALGGFSLADVKVHRDSPEPAKLGALAFAKGSEIHLGPGQEQHLPHEAWHVVQQKQGRVRPTTQMKGVAVNESASLEQEADRMGGRAAGGPGATVAARTIDLRPVPEVLQRQRVRCEPDDGVAYAPPAPLEPSQACLDLIMQSEGCAKKRADGNYDAYPDPATGGDPWTIGWGSTGPDIIKGTVWTQQQCDDRLAADVADFASSVRTAIGTAHTSQNQFDAMTSFAYNVGASALAGSTLLKKHKDGKYAEAAKEFGKWVNAGGKKMAGLVTRRAAEAALYSQ